MREIKIIKSRWELLFNDDDDYFLIKNNQTEEVYLFWEHRDTIEMSSIKANNSCYLDRGSLFREGSSLGMKALIKKIKLEDNIKE